MATKFSVDINDSSIRRMNLFQALQLLISKKRKQRTTTQDTMNYKRMYQNGVCQVSENKYSKMIRFSDISYQLSQDEIKQRIFAHYSTLLNSFDNAIKIQLSFINYRMMNEDNYEEIVSAIQESSEISLEDFDSLRKEYFSFLQEQREKGSNGIIRDKYLLFSVEDASYESAVRRLANIESTVESNFRVMGVACEPVNGIDRLSIMNYLMNGDTNNYIDLTKIPKDEFEKFPTKEFIAPKYLEFRPEYFRLNKRYGTTLYYSIEASELSDRVLSDFLDLELELIVNMHLYPLEQQSAVKMVRRKTSDLDTIKIEEQKKAIRAGYDMDILPTDLNMNVEETKRILRELQRENEKFFYMTFTITVIEDNKKSLDNAVFRLKNIASQQNCTLKTMRNQQEKAFVSALPLGNNINELELERGLTTSSTAIFIPFTTQELYQEGNDPVYYGLNALSNNLIQVSRKALRNPNGLMLGTPGSGKSFSAKREIIDVYLRTTDDILICDPEGEYYPFIKRLGGEEIKIAINSTDFINPLDISLEYGEGENPVAFKSDFILTMMEMIAGGKTGLSAKEKSIVDRCVQVIYKAYVNEPTNENIPILEDLYNAFLDTETVEGNELASSLELYVHGSLNVFNNRTTIQPNNRLLCFNIKELGSNLRKLGMLVLQDHVWNKVTTNRNIRNTWYYMDEFHVLLQEEQTSNYSVEFWKRFRKWGGVPTGITQNVKDILSSPKIETILENSDFIYLLNQATGDRNILQEKLEISDYQSSYITNSGEGEGLIIYNGDILPFKDKFPKNNSLYPVMTTKPDEIASYEEREVQPE